MAHEVQYRIPPERFFRVLETYENPSEADGMVKHFAFANPEFDVRIIHDEQRSSK